MQIVIPMTIIKMSEKIAKRPFVLKQKCFEATERHKQKNRHHLGITIVNVFHVWSSRLSKMQMFTNNTDYDAGTGLSGLYLFHS